MAFMDVLKHLSDGLDSVSCGDSAITDAIKSVQVDDLCEERLDKSREVLGGVVQLKQL